jgi:hypothetical protein
VIRIYRGGNTQTAWIDLVTPDPNTGEPIPAVSLTGIELFLSEFEDGLNGAVPPVEVAIHSTLRKAAAFYVNKPDRYHAQFEGADLNQYLAPYDNKEIWLVAVRGTDLRRSTKILVDPRRGNA